ncbi:fungal-specific transcription factor domain-containing protein [Armillaria fumosa]|nr:fungal-specific transcription factor domain-containing protein [Armillaria fumosa]
MAELRTSSRPIQSCFQCRKRKIKCNRAYPCAPCMLRGEGGQCKEVDRNAVASGKTATETLDDVLGRLAILEQTVSKLVSSGNQGKDKEKVKDKEKGRSAIRSSFGVTSTDEDVAMMLEDFAMGHRVNRNRATQDFDMTNNNEDPYTSANPSSGHPLLLLLDPSVNIMARLVAMLPDETRTRALVQFYFERLEWYSKVLHAPTFISELNVLLMQKSSESLGMVRVSFLGVYFMILCLSLHLIEPYVCESIGIDFSTASELSKRMYSAAQACLHYDDFLGAHSLEHLQCILLMGVYQQNLDEADTHWALLGSAVKIAQNLGMSRLGSESDQRTYSATWKSLVKRETARRVWWSLVFNDWSHAAAHNGTYAIHPSQNHTGWPANVNDSDLVDDGRPLRPRPTEEYTEMTFSLTRLRFVVLYREIVDDMQAPTGYSFVGEMDKRLEEMLKGVPEHFITDDNSSSGDEGVKGLELNLCLIMGETRRLRLHRPYLFRGYKDRKYVKSREQCIASAQAILDHLKSDDEQSAILLKWWIVLFYGFAAAVVLFIDLCHQKAADDGQCLDQRRAELRQALDLFKTAEHISVVSRNAIVLLEGLLTAEPDLPSKPSRKRGRDKKDDESEGEPFERIAKRMIIDASKNSSSPGSVSAGSGSGSNASPTAILPTFQIPRSGYKIYPDVMLDGPGFTFGETTMAELAGLLYSDYGWAMDGFGVHYQ